MLSQCICESILTAKGAEQSPVIPFSPCCAAYQAVAEPSRVRLAQAEKALPTSFFSCLYPSAFTAPAASRRCRPTPITQNTTIDHSPPLGTSCYPTDGGPIAMASTASTSSSGSFAFPFFYHYPPYFTLQVGGPGALVQCSSPRGAAGNAASCPCHAAAAAQPQCRQQAASGRWNTAPTEPSSPPCAAPRCAAPLPPGCSR